MVLGQVDIHLKTTECWTFYLVPSTKFNSSWIVNLNVKGKKKKVKLLGENLGAYVMTLEQATIS